MTCSTSQAPVKCKFCIRVGFLLCIRTIHGRNCKFIQAARHMQIVLDLRECSSAAATYLGA